MLNYPPLPDSEPIIYVNNRPFVVRQMDEPFANLEITGIQPQEVEAMEERLKADILLVHYSCPFSIGKPLIHYFLCLCSGCF